MLWCSTLQGLQYTGDCQAVIYVTGWKWLLAFVHVYSKKNHAVIRDTAFISVNIKNATVVYDFYKMKLLKNVICITIE